jgi:signal transduction histidine kinase
LNGLRAHDKKDFMRRLITIATFILLGGQLPTEAGVGNPAAPLKHLTLTQLETQLADIDSELEQLANFTVRGGTGTSGYRSKIHKQPDSTEWIRIELGEAVAVDEIVLVPTLYRDSKSGLRSAGFPITFRILAGTAHTTNVVASFSAEDQLLPRIAPLTVPFQPVMASWVAIEATTLSPDPNVVSVSRLQLSEIMVFSGMKNVALQKPLRTASPDVKTVPGWHKRMLTDGFIPFLLNAAQGPSSQSQVIRLRSTTSPLTMTLDLNASQPIHQINLHTADVTLSVPMTRFSCWAVPRHVRITGANRPDFADETFLCEYNQKSIYDNGPIIMRSFPETRCRYIRLEILDADSVVKLDLGQPRFAFSEIEVLSKGRNIAQGAPITTSFRTVLSRNTLARITDGSNFFGAILPARDWMEQLARRHDLERERPLVDAELARRFDRQKTQLRRMIWLTALLAVGTVIILLSEKVIRQRAVFRTRERIAANLHDELSANLHTIGLFGDLAKQEVQNAGADERWSKLVSYIHEVRTLTQQAGKTARYCSNMLEAKELYENLADEMEQTAKHLLIDLDHNISFTNTEMLQKLQPRRRIGLYLFYKECLTNIIRHSGATRVETRLDIDQKRICLTIRDNGSGMDELPPSLTRRARLLKAKLSIESPDSGGAEITLRLRPLKQGLAKRLKLLYPKSR